MAAQFIQEVVYDSMSQLSFSWHEAYALVLVYLEAIELNPNLFRLDNVVAAGSQDTRCQAAKLRAKLLFKKTKDLPPLDDEPVPAWACSG